MTDHEYMQMAVEKGRESIAAGQTPFAAVIVRAGQVVASAHNTVWRDTDPTAHAEVNAIRQAARALGNIDLGGCVMFTTCEPCPMCLSAIHWSKIERVVYGATIADAATAGFSELHVEARKLAEMGGSHLRVEALPGCEDCRALFDLWRKAARSATY